MQNTIKSIMEIIKRDEYGIIRIILKNLNAVLLIFIIIFIVICIMQKKGKINLRVLMQIIKKFIRLEIQFEVRKMGIATFIPLEYRKAYWNPKEEFDINLIEAYDGYSIEIGKVYFNSNKMLLKEINVLDKNNKEIQITKNDGKIIIGDKKYTIKPIKENEEYKWMVNGLSANNVYADTKMKIEIKRKRKNEYIFAEINLPLKDEDILNGIDIKEYVGFCAYGGFVGIGSLIGIFLFGLILLIAKELFILGLICMYLIFIVSLALNKRLYVLIRNNLQGSNGDSEKIIEN